VRLGDAGDVRRRQKDLAIDGLQRFDQWRKVVRDPGRFNLSFRSNWTFDALPPNRRDRFRNLTWRETLKRLCETDDRKTGSGLLRFVSEERGGDWSSGDTRRDLQKLTPIDLRVLFWKPHRSFSSCLASLSEQTFDDVTMNVRQTEVPPL
jgi:hypothetical protein